MATIKGETTAKRKNKNHSYMETMTIAEKIEYIFMYKKTVIFLVIFILFGIGFGIHLYKNNQTETLLYTALVDSSLNSTAEADLSEQFAAYVADDNPYHQYTLDTTITFDASDTDSESSYYYDMKEMALIESETLDLCICPQSYYEEIKDLYTFADLRDILDENVYQKYKSQLSENGTVLKLTDGILYDSSAVNYTPAYVFVMDYSTHKKQAGQMLQYLLEE